MLPKTRGEKSIQSGTHYFRFSLMSFALNVSMWPHFNHVLKARHTLIQAVLVERPQNKSSTGVLPSKCLIQEKWARVQYVYLLWVHFSLMEAIWR